ncbi:two component transcriptional regulator, LytTR family [Muriicola jejuensis]|uniref:Response regulator n=1 Tax=Muriicola jejuensis TaxID=504488 RepID=A0A6P0UDV2_9FLAO|nr:LytTR family DNA-binding domain-containing protein [Muriicola jejuensis]NER09443.1 response regulator [Muriicola jejuensis]SMP08622.1 two component transcriptional regulator, LytTR family [Muriicola jejuensis]
MLLNCLIVDDEPTSQKVLETFVNKVDFLDLAGICGDAMEALQHLQKEKIDLMFLDINMPKISGLTFLKSLKNPPEVIFTTAYSKYAIDGFDLNAVDYLLKPFSFDRFYTAVTKVLEKSAQIGPTDRRDHYLIVKADKTLHKVNIDDILFVEAYGDYVKIHIDDHFLLTNSTFTNILDQLPKKKFIRSHKSFAINLDKLNSLSGNQVFIGKHKIPIGQKFKSDFLRILNNL